VLPTTCSAPQYRAMCPVAVWVHSKQASYSYGGLLQSHLIQGRVSKTRHTSGVLREKVTSTRVSEGRREGEGRGGGLPPPTSPQ
jgi:hypothetical protein